MHIVHLDLGRGWRGGQRQVFLLIRELQDLDVRQTLVCRTGSPFLERLANMPRVVTVPARNRLDAFFRLPGDGRRLIYHAHTGNTVPLAVFGAGRRHRSVITRRLDLSVHASLFRRADRVVAISPRVEEVLLEAGIPPERLRLIPSAIDTRRQLDPQAGQRFKAELGIAPDHFVGLTVAALVEEKDPLTLVKALPHLPGNYRHIWVGSGRLEGAVRSLARELGVEDRLLMAGFDPEPDRWFGIADVFVFPSLHEGFGSALLDAFQFGVPVAGTDIPGTAHLAEDEVSALLFPPGDDRALAQRIERLMQLPETAAKLTEEGRRRGAAYDIRKTAAQYAELYEELIGVKR